MSQIPSLLRQLSNTSCLPACGIICTVDAVDAKTRTIDCTPLDESAPLLGGQGGMQLVIDEQGVVLNGGKLGGAVKVETLTERLNTIERDLNQLRQQLSAWTPIPQDGGAALKAATANWTAHPLALTERTMLENPKLKH